MKTQTENSTQRESKRGFITAPTLEQLKPTKREQALLKQLWDWQEQSAKSQIVLGVPLNQQRLDRDSANLGLSMP